MEICSSVDFKATHFRELSRRTAELEKFLKVCRSQSALTIDSLVGIATWNFFAGSLMLLSCFYCVLKVIFGHQRIKFTCDVVLFVLTETIRILQTKIFSFLCILRQLCDSSSKFYWRSRNYTFTDQLVFLLIRLWTIRAQ